MNLDDLGWHLFFSQSFDALCHSDWVPARIAREDRDSYVAFTEEGELRAELAGKLRHEAASRRKLPAVGDWVAVQLRPGENAATIHSVLPRRSCFSRKAAGARTDEQILAANVDTVFLVCGLDGDFNLRRIERYLTAAWESAAEPVILLNKSDLCAEVDARLSEVESVAAGVPVLSLSAKDRRGLDQLRPYLTDGKTVVLLGSSGVGKSTLINALCGDERQRVNTVREDDSHGRHTTTYRELVLLPGGGVLIDTPGLRELAPWCDAEQVGGTFEELEALAGQCRFHDCQHRSEPGCAIKQAVERGEIDAGRLENYLKLQREAAHLRQRSDYRARLAEKARWKQISLAVRDLKKRGKI